MTPKTTPLPRNPTNRRAFLKELLAGAVTASAAPVFAAPSPASARSWSTA